MNGNSQLLLISSDSDAHRDLQPILSGRWSVTRVPDFSTALETLRTSATDLIIAESQEGDEATAFLRTVRLDPRTHTLPVLLLLEPSDDVWQTPDVLADDYLVRPWRPGQVIARVNTLLRLRRSEGALAALSQQISDTPAVPTSTVTELQHALQFHERFTGILAHDLRNPLAVIMTACHLAKMRAGDDEKLARSLARISTSGERMALMVEQLLELSRLCGSNPVDLHPKEADLADLVGQALSHLGENGTTHAVRVVPSGDLRGLWDPERLSQSVMTLVANAVEYGSPQGSATVRLDGTETDGVLLEVHNGGAIAPDLLAKLFDPVAPERRRTHGRGLGLGLFLAREIARLHGGKIDVRSDELAGTTLSMTLPRRWLAGDAARVASHGAGQFGLAMR